MARKKVVKEWTWDDYEPEKLQLPTAPGTCHSCKGEVPCRVEKETGKSWCSPCWMLFIGTGGCPLYC